jgi:hypothetical protein
VLFSKVIKSPLDAMASIHALLEVMKEHRKQFSSKPQTRRLNVKGAAWLAGFPINNAEIILAARSQLDTAGYLDDPVAENYRLLDAHEVRDSANLYLADYIGPSVDLGFRLREHATPRRLIISADLAWLLCFGHREIAASEQGKSKYSKMPYIGYDGRHGLKGILGGEPYPLVWIESDIGNAIDKAEDRLLRRDHPDEAGPALHSVDPLWEFCEAFLTGQGPLRMCPYIPDYPSKRVGTITAEHQKRLQEIEEIVNGPATQLASIDQSDNGSGKIPKEASDFAYLVLNDSEGPPGGAKTTLPSKGKSTRSRKSSS